eukprot:626871-Rhodomonas_salina.4
MADKSTTQTVPVEDFTYPSTHPQLEQSSLLVPEHLDSLVVLGARVAVRTTVPLPTRPGTTVAGSPIRAVSTGYCIGIQAPQNWVPHKAYELRQYWVPCRQMRSVPTPAVPRRVNRPPFWVFW